MDLSFSRGARLLVRGLRRSDAGTAAAGAAVLAIALLRATAAPKREHVESVRLRRGRSLRIDVVGT